MKKIVFLVCILNCLAGSAAASQIGDMIDDLEKKTLKDKIEVLQKDQRCESDSDCTTTMVNCVKLACECGTPINKQYHFTYKQKLDACVQAHQKAGTQMDICEMECSPAQNLCIQNKCVLFELSPHLIPGDGEEVQTSITGEGDTEYPVSVDQEIEHNQGP